MKLFSLIICAYNPRAEVLEKVIGACLSQQRIAGEAEIILVDNNSAPALATLPFVAGLVQDRKISLVTEKRQGLVYARLAGTKAASAENLVFVDDDNILDHSFLKHLGDLFQNYPQVAVWGPGRIDVDYPEGAPAWVINNFSWLFQQKHNTQTQYGCVVGWPDYYPAGSGMAVRKSVMKEYSRLFENGALSMTGRKGATLSSGEDSQIVWTAVKMGLAAGTSPELRLVHVIPAKRTGRAYLAALNFGIAQSYAAAMLEMFPGSEQHFKKRSPAGKLNFVIRQFLKSKGNPLLFYRLYTIENSWFRGIASAR